MKLTWKNWNYNFQVFSVAPASTLGPASFTSTTRSFFSSSQTDPLPNPTPPFCLQPGRIETQSWSSKKEPHDPSLQISSSSSPQTTDLVSQILNHYPKPKFHKQINPLLASMDFKRISAA